MLLQELMWMQFATSFVTLSKVSVLIDTTMYCTSIVFFSFLSYLCHYTLYSTASFSTYSKHHSSNHMDKMIMWGMDWTDSHSVAVSSRVTDLVITIRLNLVVSIDHHLIRCDFSYFDDIDQLTCHTTTTLCDVPYITSSIISCAVQISVDCRLKMVYHSSSCSR